MSDDEVRDKFRRNARRALPPDSIEAVIAHVAQLDEAPSAQPMARSCTPATGHDREATD
jgi:hypothetical protein